MFVSNVVNGLLIGFPLMLAVGPIAILLLDQGLARGHRSAAPAAFGVASADLTFSILAAVAGTSIAVFLAPITSWLSLAAVALLLVLALRLFRVARSELRSLGVAAIPLPATAAETRGLALDTGSLGSIDMPTGSVEVVEIVGVVDSTSPVDVVGLDVGDDHYATTLVAEDRYGVSTFGAGSASAPHGEAARTAASGSSGSEVTFGHLSGFRLGAAFYGLTVVNPLTIVLFAAVVVAGGAGAGTPGWAIGVALSSLIVHGGWVLLGSALGTSLGPVAIARMRLCASVLMAGLAVHFLMG